MRRRDPRLAVCDGNHADDGACCIKTGTFKAEYAPLAYQFPKWGTEDWREMYARRSGVERSYNLFKNQDVVGLAKEHFRLRNLENVTVLAIAGWVAVNLYLRALDRRDAEKLCRRPPDHPRAHPPASIEVLPAFYAPFQPVPLLLTT